MDTNIHEETLYQKVHALSDASQRARDLQALCILDASKDYIITPIKKSFSASGFNVTYRSPVGAGNNKASLVCTTSIDVAHLSALRVEMHEGVWCVISDGQFNEKKMAVTSENVGLQLIRDLINRSSQPDLPDALSDRNKQLVEVIEKLSPAIWAIAGAMLSLSGTFWLITH